MFTKYFYSKTRFWLLPSLLLGCTLALGCASWDRAPEESTSEPQPEPDTSWGSQFRSKGPEGQYLGLDPRARDIENSLGVR